MNDQENFLSRWSRRKLEPADEKVPAQPPQSADAPPAGEDAAKAAGAAPARQGEAVPEFDVSTLPSLDSIGADSDITAFLQTGVPLALKHAALRRAWSADPAIRDFVGLAENAWDFNDPNAIPGFGPLDHTPEQVRQMVSELFGEPRRVAGKVVEINEELPRSPTSGNETNELSSLPAREPAVAANIEHEQIAAFESEPESKPEHMLVIEDNKQDTATQQRAERDIAQPRRQIHGGALPR